MLEFNKFYLKGSYSILFSYFQTNRQNCTFSCLNYSHLKILLVVLLFCVYGCLAYMYVCASPHVCCTLGGHKSGTEVTVRLHVVLETEPGSLQEPVKSQCS